MSSVDEAIDLLKNDYFLVSKVDTHKRCKRYYDANRDKILEQRRLRIAAQPPKPPKPPPVKIRCKDCSREFEEDRFPAHLTAKWHLDRVHRKAVAAANRLARMNRKNLKTIKEEN